MKKLILSLTASAFLFGGIVIFNETQSNQDGKNIAAGGEREPSVLSVKSYSVSL